MKRFLAYLSILVSVLSIALSCVRDEAPIFDKSSSARMNQYLLDTRDVLVGASNGWVMYYYPNGPGASRETQSIGGFVFTMKFTDEKVTDHYNVHVTVEDTVPAISPLFLAAFVFENETHDLYGINIEGIAIDFKGNFYQVALDKPMTIDTQDSDMYSVAKKYGVEVDGGEA